MKKGIIITSFGTSYEETRKKNIEPIEDLARELFKDYHVLRAFTSRMIINKLKKRDNLHIDNPTEAMNKLKYEEVEEIYIQPLLIIEGHEYDKLKLEIQAFQEENPTIKLKLARPLLNSNEDYEKVLAALEVKNYGNGEALIFMGHGTDHYADISYEKLQDFLIQNGHENVFIGTVEGSKSVGNIIPILKEKDIKKIELLPFMLVAGDHAINDMAGDEDSWKTILEAEGFEVKAVIKGLGELKGIKQIFMDHLREII